MELSVFLQAGSVILIGSIVQTVLMRLIALMLDVQIVQVMIVQAMRVG